MTRLGIPGPALRTGLAAGLAAAVVAWTVFVGLGGSGGMPHAGSLPPMAVFLADIMLFGYAGFRLRRSGHDQPTAVLGGLVAGLTSGLLASFPRSAILLMSRGYMRVLQATPQHAGPTTLHLPSAPITVLFALAGATLASLALGAACGSIGGSLARPSDRVEAQLP